MYVPAFSLYNFNDNAVEMQMMTTLWYSKSKYHKSAHKILIYGPINFFYNSTERLTYAWSYRSWISSPSNDTKSRYIDIAINDPSSNLCYWHFVLLFDHRLIQLKN